MSEVSLGNQGFFVVHFRIRSYQKDGFVATYDA
jgi:hypothetical protein